MITMKDIIREGNPLLHENAKDVVLPLSKDDEELMQSVAELVLIRKGLKRGDNG